MWRIGLSGFMQSFGLAPPPRAAALGATQAGRSAQIRTSGAGRAANRAILSKIVARFQSLLPRRKTATRPASPAPLNLTDKKVSFRERIETEAERGSSRTARLRSAAAISDRDDNSTDEEISINDLRARRGDSKSFDESLSSDEAAFFSLPFEGNNDLTDEETSNDEAGARRYDLKSLDEDLSSDEIEFFSLPFEGEGAAPSHVEGLNPPDAASSQRARLKVVQPPDDLEHIEHPQPERRLRSRCRESRGRQKLWLKTQKMRSQSEPAKRVLTKYDATAALSAGHAGEAALPVKPANDDAWLADILASVDKRLAEIRPHEATLDLHATALARAQDLLESPSSRDHARGQAILDELAHIKNIESAERRFSERRSDG